MQIVIAEKKDLKEILELQKACYLEEAELYDDFSIPPLTQTLGSIERDFSKTIFLKVETEGRIIGSIRGRLDWNTCKIERLVVGVNFRNQGLGTKLMHSIEWHFSNVKRFELFTGHKSVRNLSLYDELGYTPFKKQRVNEKLELIFLEKLNIKS